MAADTIGSGVIGHATVIRLLASWLQHPANGYLFHGPAHLGKKTLAEQCVSALLDAPSPQSVVAHPDLIRLEPVEGKTIISVEQIREARLMLSGRSMVASRRVLFIPAADRLNEEGMNALLKVLEEPPAGAVFVFVTHDITRLPATVQSRMVNVPFSSVSLADLVEGLVARGMDRQQAEHRAIASHGRPGIALEPRDRDKRPEQFFNASTVGERLFLIDQMTKTCESTDDAPDAWRAALDDFCETIRDHLSSDPTTALVTGEAVVTARRFVGGAISPRLALEAAAARLALRDSLSNLFPSHISHPFARIFSLHV